MRKKSYSIAGDQMNVVAFKMVEDGQSNQCYGGTEFKIKTAKLDI